MRKFKLYAEQSGANESYLLRIATLDNSLKCHCGFQGGKDISVLKGNKLDREGCLVKFIPHASTTIKLNSTIWDQPPFIVLICKLIMQLKKKKINLAVQNN